MSANYLCCFFPINIVFTENRVFNKTYSGTPKGGIISPVLAIIYLDKLDKYSSEYITKFNKGRVKK